jgi:hypothetical protein
MNNLGWVYQDLLKVSVSLQTQVSTVSLHSMNTTTDSIFVSALAA